MATDKKIGRLTNRLKRLKMRLANVGEETAFIKRVIDKANGRLDSYLEKIERDAEKANGGNEVSPWELANYIVDNGKLTDILPDPAQVPVDVLLRLFWWAIIELHEEGTLKDWSDRVASEHKKHLEGRIERLEERLARI